MTDPSTSDYGARFEGFGQHADMLAASGIMPEHARARGYMPVAEKTRLESIGVTKAGRRVPGLLVPSLRADGSVWGYQYRPDDPRLRDGRPVKYETPTGQRNGIDVPPGVGPKLDDPAVPLWVTEGVKKADAAAVNGLCCVALPGVWSWRGRNDKGGKTAVPDWHDVALNDRRVILAFDSDVMVKPAVRKALDELAGYLRSKGASVEFCHLPNDDASKTGIDDYLTDGHTADDLLKLVRPEPPAAVDSGPVGPVGPLRPVPGRGGENAREPETGELLAEVRAWLARFVCTVDEGDLDLLTLWAAHTHLCVETYTTPRLILDSPVPESGKTTTMEHLQRLCLNPVQMASLSSPALLTRMLDAGLRTILIDEADRSLNPDKDGVPELLAVLNSGYKRGGTRPVLVPDNSGKGSDGWKAKEMPTFAPVAMAGNNPNLPDDTQSRSLRVLLLPDIHGEAEESDWEYIEDEAYALGGRLALWAHQVRDDVRTTRPALPDGVIGRARERWGPLKRVAVAAGGRWPAVVDQLAAKDVADLAADKEDGLMQQRPGAVLMMHLHEVWPEGEPFVATEVLIGHLVLEHPETWGEMSSFGKRLTAQRMGRMLVKGYRVRSDRPDHDGPRGYLRAALAPAFRRLGLDEPHERTKESHSGTPRGYQESGDASDPSSEPANLAESAQPARTSECGVCTKRLVPKLIAAGYTAHPACIDDREAS